MLQLIASPVSWQLKGRTWDPAACSSSSRSKGFWEAGAGFAQQELAAGLLPLHRQPGPLVLVWESAKMALSQRDEDLKMMLAAQCHLGTKNCDAQMERYIYKRRASDGIYIINLGKTWDKLQLAARVIVAIENPVDIVVQSARPYAQRAVLKFAFYTGAKALAGRYTPGAGPPPHSCVRAACALALLEESCPFCGLCSARGRLLREVTCLFGAKGGAAAL